MDSSCTLQMSRDFAKRRRIAIDVESSNVGNILSLRQLILEEARKVGWSWFGVSSRIQGADAPTDHLKQSKLPRDERPRTQFEWEKLFL
jgi:hypothetical protein